MQSRLSTFASVLGVGGSEIFPKQTELLTDRGDAGSWINMPYFGGNTTDRYAFNEQGFPIKDCYEFVKYAASKMIGVDELIAVSTVTKDPVGPDAPPCLNQLALQGFPEGTRNNGLMHAGVYCMKKNKDTWEKDLDIFNSTHMDVPLSSQEVMGIIKSLKKKEYNYLCNQHPMKSYCDKAKCRMCKYGIGPATGMPALGTLTKFETDPPLWFVDIEDGGRLELTTEDLQQPLKFQKACMDQLNIMPPVLKRETWSEMVSTMLDSVNIVKVPVESTPRGIFLAHLEDFLNTRAHDDASRDVLLNKQPWIDKGYFHFRMKDLMDYLYTCRFQEFKQNKVASILKTLNAEHGFCNIKGRGVNYYTLPVGCFKQTSPFDVPKQSANSPI